MTVFGYAVRAWRRYEQQLAELRAAYTRPAAGLQAILTNPPTSALPVSAEHPPADVDD